MNLAYADPPYPGNGHRYPEKVETNHPLLIDYLDREFDAWALSTGSNNLQEILPLCPPSVRIAAWVKPFASFKPNVNPAYAWEPVIFKGGRRRTRDELTVRDWVSTPITLQKGLVGAKPEAFCMWLFDLLGAQRGDEFTDVFPGTGGVTKAWERYSAQMRLVTA